MIHLRRFRPLDLGLLAAMFALSLMATLGAWRDIAEQALRDQEQTHILLALPVAVWLAVLRRQRLHGFRPKWSMAGSGWRGRRGSWIGWRPRRRCRRRCRPRG